MVKHILVVRQLPCNEINNEVAIKNKTEIQLCGGSNNQPPDKVNIEDEHINNKYLSFSTAQQIIHRLITCSRIGFTTNRNPRNYQTRISKKIKFNTKTTQIFTGETAVL